ncbi:hypothetical protein VCRA2114E365_10016 [Vibrio crassostreae]|nr:hypothetical protein VCRA2119O381_130011 [Vibrio crassostreae]CAK1824427.1 hypothetical protein VCRA2115O371_10016 [Vibrio crassostreae]CAK1831813.1 hypothetical protein VCRA2113O199_10016 [Vibrio crassostreae]CAK1834571.1 hypothetical protein VCRA2113O362_10016 [Vibrio crassostreae]CAK1835762.1 hypothetical protein VCRA2113O354_10016 [Vibrio crassostreae]
MINKTYQLAKNAEKLIFQILNVIEISFYSVGFKLVVVMISRVKYIPITGVVCKW